MAIKRVKAKDFEKVFKAALESGKSVTIRVKNDRKGHTHYLRSCYCKVKYGRQETAFRAISDMTQRGIAGLEAYECEFCGKWHVGHPNPAVKIIDNLVRHFDNAQKRKESK